jgi:hypothetical protein
MTRLEQTVIALKQQLDQERAASGEIARALGAEIARLRAHNETLAVEIGRLSEPVGAPEEEEQP